MKPILKTFAFLGLMAFGFGARPAEAQVSFGVATPGFSLGVGPGAGFVGGYYPGYPVVAPVPIYAPRPVFVPPPIYGRPYYAGGYGRGYYGPHYGPHYGGGPRYYRR